MFQLSYLTEIQIWLVSGYLRLRISEKKRCNTNWRDDIVRFSGNELWKRVPKQEFISKPRGGWGGGWWTQQQFIRISKDGFPQLCEQGDNISRIKWYNDVCSRRTSTNNIGWKVQPSYGLGCTTNVGMAILATNTPNWNNCPLTLKQ